MLLPEFIRAKLWTLRCHHCRRIITPTEQDVVSAGPYRGTTGNYSFEAKLFCPCCGGVVTLGFGGQVPWAEVAVWIAALSRADMRQPAQVQRTARAGGRGRIQMHVGQYTLDENAHFDIRLSDVGTMISLLDEDMNLRYTIVIDEHKQVRLQQIARLHEPCEDENAGNETTEA